MLPPPGHPPTRRSDIPSGGKAGELRNELEAAHGAMLLKSNEEGEEEAGAGIIATGYGVLGEEGEGEQGAEGKSVTGGSQGGRGRGKWVGMGMGMGMGLG